MTGAGRGLLFNNLQPIGVGARWLGPWCCPAWKGGVVLGGSKTNEVLTQRSEAGHPRGWLAERLVLGQQCLGMGPTLIELLVEIELKSLILAQIERWRHALHMQVERQRGGNPGGERRTGEEYIGTYPGVGDNAAKAALIPHML